jgi:hypothetical protein
MPRFAGTPVEEAKPRFAGVPVDASTATVQPAVAAQPAPAPAPAPAAPPQEDFWSSLMGGLGYGLETASGVAGNVREGMARTAGLPVDLVNMAPMLANLIPGVDGVGPMSEKPVGGGDWLDELTRGYGLVPEAPEGRDALQTVLNRVGKEVGGMAVPVGGQLAAAARTTLPAVRESGGLGKYLLEPFLVDPAKAVGKEVAAATAAGTGAGIANLFVDPNTPQGQLADFGGAMGGVGLASLGDVLLRGLGNVAGAAFQRPSYIDQTVKDAVVDRLGKAGGLDEQAGPMDTQALVDAIENPRAGRPSEVIPGFKESIADVTGDPGLAAFEYSRQSGPNAGQFAQRRGANNEAVDTAMRNVEPQETPGAFRDALSTEADARLRAASGATDAAQSEFDNFIATLRPNMGAEERGATIRGGLQNAERAARESEDSVWRAITGEVDPTDLPARFDAAQESMPLARQDLIDGNWRNVPDRLTDVPEGEAIPPVNIDEMTSLRSVMLTEQRNALRGPQPDRNKAEAIQRYIDEIDGYMGEAAPRETIAQIDTARGVSRQVNEDFNRPNDPIARVLSTKEGRPDVPDSAVGKQFVQPDSRQASNIDRLLAQTDLSSQAVPVRDALRNEILDGVDLTDPARMDAYLNQFSRVFDRFPDLRGEIEQAAGAGRGVKTAQDAQVQTETQIEKGQVGKYLQYSDANAERAISEVLSAKDPGKAADELLSFVDGNPKAAEGARAAFWQKLKTEAQSSDNAQRSMTGGRQWRGDWLKSFLDKPATAAVAERLYRDAPEQLDTLRKYAEVLDNVDLRQRGRAPGTSGTAQGTNPVLSPETLQSRFYAYMRGQVGGTYLATSIAAVVARRWVRRAQTEAIERLTDKVLLNPDEAAILLKENNPANRAALARKAKGWLGNEAATLLDVLEGPDEEDADDGR